MTKVENILNRNMNRSQFIGLIGLAIISLLGVPTLLSIFSSDKSQAQKHPSSGYGSTSYGRS